MSDPQDYNTEAEFDRATEAGGVVGPSARDQQEEIERLRKQIDGLFQKQVRAPQDDPEFLREQVKGLSRALRQADARANRQYHGTQARILLGQIQGLLMGMTPRGGGSVDPLRVPEAAAPSPTVQVLHMLTALVGMLIDHREMDAEMAVAQAESYDGF